MDDSELEGKSIPAGLYNIFCLKTEADFYKKKNLIVKKYLRKLCPFYDFVKLAAILF